MIDSSVFFTDLVGVVLNKTITVKQRDIAAAAHILEKA